MLLGMKVRSVWLKVVNVMSILVARKVTAETRVRVPTQPIIGSMLVSAPTNTGSDLVIVVGSLNIGAVGWLAEIVVVYANS